MTPRKKKPEVGALSKAGLWSVAAGERPFTVRVREEEVGGMLLFDFTDPDTGRRRKPSAGIRVRDDRGRIDPDLERQALELAKDRSAALRLQRLRTEVEPARITVALAFARFHDDEKGGMPASYPARRRHVVSRQFWTRALGAETPWNAVTPAEVENAAMKLVRAGKAPTAAGRVKDLRRVGNWLRLRAGIDGLRDPVRGLDWKKLWEGHTVQRPRFTVEEARKMLDARSRMNPKTALFLALVDDAGVRGKAMRLLMRSAIDAPLELPPPAELAPYGWVVFPALKGQDVVVHFLTLFERVQLVRALWKRWDGERWVPGYLSELEREYDRHARDYPIFPGRKLRDLDLVITPSGSAYRPVSIPQAKAWLDDAERAAGVQHVRGRGWHGLRRLWSDIVHDQTDLGVLTAAGAWSSQRVPESIYLAKTKYGHLARAREAMERRRQ